MAGRTMAIYGDVTKQLAMFLDAVGEFDATNAVRFWAGINTTAHWVAWACSIAPGTAREYVRVARALRRMPRTRARFAGGELTYSKVREMTRLVDVVADPADQPNADAAEQPSANAAEQPSRAADRLDPDVADQDDPDAAEHSEPDREDPADPPAPTDVVSAADGESAERQDDEGAASPPDGELEPGWDTRPDREARLVDYARQTTASQLARSITGYRTADGADQRQRPKHKVSWWTDPDGNIHFSAILPAEEGAYLITALQAATDANQPPDPKAGDIQPDDQQPEELCADDLRYQATQRTRIEAVHEIATHYLASRPEDRSGEDRTLVVLEINASALDTDFGADFGAGDICPVDDDSRSEDVPRPASVDHGPVVEGTEPAYVSQPGSVPAGTSPDTGNHPAKAATDATAVARVTDESTPATAFIRPQGVPAGTLPPTCRVRRGGAIEASAARRELCDTQLLGVIINDLGEPLAVGRSQRLVTRAQRRAFMIRDGCCQYPGCPRNRRLQAHHRISWLSGGVTALDNLILLCKWHHPVVHESKISITPCDQPTCTVRWRFTRPDGVMITPKVFGIGSRSPWYPLVDPDGGVLRGPTLDAAGKRRDRLVAEHRAEQLALHDQQDELRRRYGHIDDTDHPEAHRVFPVGGGEGFNLANCVDVLFNITKHDATRAA